MERLQLAINHVCSFDLGDGQKANIVLVLCDEKKSAYVDIFKFNEVSVETVKKALEFAGLVFAQVQKLNGHKFICRLAIAKTQDLADALKNATDAHDEKTAYLLMGYPQTAANTFAGAEKLRKWDIPAEAIANPIAFQFSKLGKGKEIALFKHWMDLLAKRAPGLLLIAYAD